MSVEVVTPKVFLLKSPLSDAAIWSAKAAKFCTSPDSISSILCDDSTDEKVLKSVLNYGHLSVTEFDGWIFGIENVSRTLTHQLVRKRLASYAQESMRYTSQGGNYKIIVPKSLVGKSYNVRLPVGQMAIDLSLEELADLAHQWYEAAQADGVPNEDARFGLLEASKTKIMMALNSHSLLDFFCERTCRCAQWEIRGVAVEMLRMAKEADPIGMANAGPKCHRTQFCIESKPKWDKCRYSTHLSEVQHLITRKGSIV